MSFNELKILSGSTKLALKQVQEVMSHFPKINYEIREISSCRNNYDKMSLLREIPKDFFTPRLYRALIDHQGDLAIYSAKYLHYPMLKGLEVVALLEAFDKTDSLVSRNNKSLKDLPEQSKVGINIKVRKEQILSIRPDLRIVKIRGSIEERINLIEKCEIEALVTATCVLKRLELENKIAEILPFKTHPLQGSLAVVALSDRADLKVLFSKVDARKNYGKVYLIGASPGDPELITIKADKILKNVNGIFYDDLLDKTILKNYSGKKTYVGKRKGKFAYSQKEINEILYKEALKGNNVARLKGGDPFIFGRGGEELRYLQERLIGVEVIPGISSAQVASASSLIPLTMRGISSKLLFLTGHSVKSNHLVDNPNSPSTMIYFMGAAKLKEISSELIGKGKVPDTPVALIQNAGLVNEKIIVSSLSEMTKIKIESPVITIIGDVVKAFNKQPKILFTGLNPEHCKVRGKIVHYPLIEIDDLNFAVERLNSYDGIVFTNKTAVNIFCKKYQITKFQKIIAIDHHTKNKIESYGYKVDYQPLIADLDNLTEFINKLKLKNILYPCSNLAYNRLHEMGNVKSEIFYKIKHKAQPKLDLQEFSGIVFSCNSTVDVFFNLYNTIPHNIIIYAYERHTVQKLAAKGYINNVQTLQTWLSK